MRTATMSLPDKTLHWIQELIRMNLDSRDGMRDAANHLQKHNGALEARFREWSAEREAQAHELQDLVSQHGEEPKNTGSVAAAAHRTWLNIRTALGAGEAAILSEAERGEDVILAKYDEALKDLHGCACCPTLEKHYAVIKVTHDKVRDLRDAKLKTKA